MSPPPIPSYLRMPHGWETLFLVLVVGFSIPAVGWAVRRWRRDGDAVPLVLMAGGTVCTLLEPLVDVLGLCWYPRGQAMPAFTLMGRPIPLFVVFGYTMQWGGGTLVMLELLRRGRYSAVWGAWAIDMAFMGAFELFAVHTKTYVYYGPQPLSVLRWPVWWEPVNALGAVACAVAIYALQLRGWRLLLILPLMTMIDAGINAAAGWPVYAALWSHTSMGVRQIGGVATCALAAFAVWLLITAARAVPRVKRETVPQRIPVAV